MAVWLAFLAGGWLMLVAYELAYVVGMANEDLFNEWLDWLVGVPTVLRQFWLGATAATAGYYLWSVS